MTCVERYGGDDAATIDESLRDPMRFGTLFARHHDDVHRLLARRVGPDRGGELTGATFAVAFERRMTYRGGDDARIWLYGIAIGQLHGASRAERGALLSGGLDAVARLDDELRDVILLDAWEGLRPGQIATALGVPLTTVGRRRLQTARWRRPAVPDVEPPSDEVRRAAQARLLAAIEDEPRGLAASRHPRRRVRTQYAVQRLRWRGTAL